MDGHGNLTLTGQLGDVMKESAQAALILCTLTRRTTRSREQFLREIRYTSAFTRWFNTQRWAFCRYYNGDCINLRTYETSRPS